MQQSLSLRWPEKVAAKDLNFTPLQHQSDVSDKLDDSEGQLVFHGLGTGKTKTIVNAAHEHGLPLVAIVPAALRNNMRKELQSSGFKQPSMVLSYEEALKKMKDPAFLEHASKSLVAFDEAHRGSSEIGQRRKLLEKLPAAKKLLATATPARNEPAELAPLINSIEPGSLPNKATDFNNQFIDTRTKPVGFFGWLAGSKGEKTRQPKNLHEFEKAVKGKVDFYQSADRSNFPSFDEKIVEVPMADKQQAAYDMVMGKYPMLWYKIKHGLPATKRDEADFKAFMSGPRQVMNHPGPYNSSATDKDAPKITAAVDEIQKRIKTDKNFRGVAFSAYLDTGVHPLSRELDRRGIPHAMFTGDQDETERKHIVESYNKGKLPVLLISGAGAEGLDLKGTKLMQILEPHWNEEMIDQVRGRAIRYKSHTHLPSDERHVEVQRFHAVPAPSWFDRLIGRHRGTDSSADEYLYNKASEKREILRPFLEILKGRPAADVESEMKQAAGPPPRALVPRPTSVYRWSQHADPFATDPRVGHVGAHATPFREEALRHGEVRAPGSPGYLHEFTLADPDQHPFWPHGGADLATRVQPTAAERRAAETVRNDTHPLERGQLTLPPRVEAVLSRPKTLNHPTYANLVAAGQNLPHNMYETIVRPEHVTGVQTTKMAEASEPGAIMCDHKWNTPGVLLDLDGTLVRMTGPWGPGGVGTQQVLPRRLEVLRMLKARGYKLIGITNRSAVYGDMDMMTLMQMNQETMEILEDLLDDILCCPEGDPRIHKPSPTMLLLAMQQYRLDPANCFMVGDMPFDEEAAKNADLPFTYADAFFTADWANVPHAIPHPAPEVLGSHRWVDDGVGNLVGTLACCGQEAVNALRKRITLHCHDMDIPTPEMIVADDVLKLKVPESLDTLAAWIDDAYEERDAGLAPAAA